MDTLNILNFILQDMFNHSNLNDMYALADPEKCKQYIVVGSKALEEIFSKINLDPKDKKDGTVYFQSVPGLLQGMSGEDKLRRERNCTRLAFYFIRVFQIFGALMLSVKDSAMPAYDPVVEVRQKALRGVATQLVSRPFRGLEGPNRPKSFFGFGGARKQHGGELTRASKTFFIETASGAEDYRLLNKYLNAPRSDSSEPLYFNSTMLIPQDSLYNGVPDNRTVKANPTPIIIYRYAGADKAYQAMARLKIQSNGSAYTISLSDVKVEGRPAKITEREDTLNQSYPGDTNPTNANGKNLPEALSDMFKTIVAQDLGFSMVEFLSERRYINLNDSITTIKGTTVSIRNPKSVQRGAAVPIEFAGNTKIEGRTRDIRITAALTMSRDADKYTMYMDFSKSVSKPDLGTNLSNRGPIVFRGRGDTEPVTDNGTTIPAYIQKVFESIVKGVATGTYVGSPRLGKGPPSSDRIPAHLRIDGLWKALSKAPPAKTVCIGRAAQLLNVNSNSEFSNICNTKFAYVVNKSVPAMGDEAVSVPSINAIASLYKGVNGAGYDIFKKAVEPVYADGRFSTPELCSKNPDSVISVPRAVKSEIQSIVRGMMRQQKRHTQEVARVLFMLFDEAHVRRGIFRFSPVVAANGMPEIERIAAVARDLLTRQLISCETEYNRGIKVLEGVAGIKATSVAPVAEPEEEEANNDADL